MSPPFVLLPLIPCSCPAVHSPWMGPGMYIHLIVVPKLKQCSYAEPHYCCKPHILFMYGYVEISWKKY